MVVFKTDLIVHDIVLLVFKEYVKNVSALLVMVKWINFKINVFPFVEME